MILISFSYAYLLALVILVASLIMNGIYLSLENKGVFSHYLSITPEGIVSINSETMSYQLLTTSRLGFFGCWLELQQRSVSINPTKKKKHVASTQVFIFRDSLSGQDFARLVSVLKQNH